MKADRLAQRLGLRELYIKNETANPTHQVQGPRRPATLARAKELGFQDDRLRIDGQPRQRGLRPRGRSGLESYVLIPADLEQEKILATGAYGTNIVAIKGNYDAVNRLCTRSPASARGRS